MERAVITGMGIYTCAGKGKELFWKNVINGVTGIRKVTLFPTAGYRTDLGGQIQEIGLEDHERAFRILSAAAEEAIADTDIKALELAKERVQIIIGTAHGELTTWEKYYSSFLNHDNEKVKEFSGNFSAWILPQRLMHQLGINCFTATVSTACTSSTLALGLALNRIRRKEAELIIVGGVDSLSQFIFSGFDSLRALTTSQCKPFDKDRDGLVLGEGGAILVVESLEHAFKRKARIYGELAGFGAYSDAVHLTAPDRNARGATLSLDTALRSSQIKPEDVSYINAHGTGTNYNDRMECVAIKKVFGNYAAKIPISSIKPVIGHTSGAAGVIEAVVCLLSIQDKVIPPTINFNEPIPDFQFDFVPNQGREVDVQTAVSMNSAFGGSNACIALRRFER